MPPVIPQTPLEIGTAYQFPTIGPIFPQSPLQLAQAQGVTGLVGPAFTPKHPLVSVGKAQLNVIGLNPQRIGTMSEGRVPGLPTFGGMDYQTTGLGERHARFEAVTYPHVVGGLDAVALLLQHHNNQEAVNFLRMTSNVTFQTQMMGSVVIRHLYLDETKLHPFDGIGRKVAVEIDLIFVGSFSLGAPSNLLT